MARKRKLVAQLSTDSEPDLEPPQKKIKPAALPKSNQKLGDAVVPKKPIKQKSLSQQFGTFVAKRQFKVFLQEVVKSFEANLSGIEMEKLLSESFGNRFCDQCERQSTDVILDSWSILLDFLQKISSQKPKHVFLVSQLLNWLIVSSRLVNETATLNQTRKIANLIAQTAEAVKKIFLRALKKGKTKHGQSLFLLIHSLSEIQLLRHINGSSEASYDQLLSSEPLDVAVLLGVQLQSTESAWKSLLDHDHYIDLLLLKAKLLNVCASITGCNDDSKNLLKQAKVVLKHITKNHDEKGWKKIINLHPELFSARPKLIQDLPFLNHFPADALNKATERPPIRQFFIHNIGEFRSKSFTAEEIDFLISALSQLSIECLSPQEKSIIAEYCFSYLSGNRECLNSGLENLPSKVLSCFDRCFQPSGSVLSATKCYDFTLGKLDAGVMLLEFLKIRRMAPRFISAALQYLVSKADTESRGGRKVVKKLFEHLKLNQHKLGHDAQPDEYCFEVMLLKSLFRTLEIHQSAESIDLLKHFGSCLLSLSQSLSGVLISCLQQRIPTEQQPAVNDFCADVCESLVFCIRLLRSVDADSSETVHINELGEKLFEQFDEFDSITNKDHFFKVVVELIKSRFLTIEDASGLLCKTVNCLQSGAVLDSADLKFILTLNLSSANFTVRLSLLESKITQALQSENMETRFDLRAYETFISHVLSAKDMPLKDIVRSVECISLALHIYLHNSKLTNVQMEHASGEACRFLTFVSVNSHLRCRKIIKYSLLSGLLVCNFFIENGAPSTAYESIIVAQCSLLSAVLWKVKNKVVQEELSVVVLSCLQYLLKVLWSWCRNTSTGSLEFDNSKTTGEDLSYEGNLNTVAKLRAAQAISACFLGLKRHGPTYKVTLIHLIAEFCCLATRYPLPPAIKNAIIPGIYSLFDIVERYALSHLQVVLKDNTRPICKALYDDYRNHYKHCGKV